MNPDAVMSELRAHAARDPAIRAVMDSVEATASMQNLNPENLIPRSLRSILYFTSQVTGVSAASIFAHNRIKHISDARHVFFRVSVKHAGKTLKGAGRFLNNRDHTTVHSSLRRSEMLMADPVFADRVQRVVEAVEDHAVDFAPVLVAEAAQQAPEGPVDPLPAEIVAAGIGYRQRQILEILMVARRALSMSDLAVSVYGESSSDFRHNVQGVMVGIRKKLSGTGWTLVGEQPYPNAEKLHRLVKQ